jgi:hypothetical protein
MNERIRELWYQAVQPHTGDSWAEQTAFMEEFAELIVKECIRVAIAKQTENDIAGIVSKNPAKDFAYALVEHFGVKE